ncbi:hypothetical protein LBMAG42_35490 [Deltaproteobacteria bacterium]|nr:hypothetical protein LBMAG42_35490 [Deltaproteobacteria bacterium]
MSTAAQALFWLCAGHRIARGESILHAWSGRPMAMGSVLGVAIVLASALAKRPVAP